eukprot:638123-Prorocentrum_minimum.AAC.5
MRGLLPPTPSGTPPGTRRSACPIAWRGRATSRNRESISGKSQIPPRANPLCPYTFVTESFFGLRVPYLRVPGPRSLYPFPFQAQLEAGSHTFLRGFWFPMYVIFAVRTAETLIPHLLWTTNRFALFSIQHISAKM